MYLRRRGSQLTRLFHLHHDVHHHVGGVFLHVAILTPTVHLRENDDFVSSHVGILCSSRKILRRREPASSHSQYSKISLASKRSRFQISQVRTPPWKPMFFFGKRLYKRVPALRRWRRGCSMVVAPLALTISPSHTRGDTTTLTAPRIDPTKP